MRKLSNISLLASASVLALTTAVYTPVGFVSAADGDEETPAAACESVEINNTNIGYYGTPVSGDEANGFILNKTNVCYTITTLTNKYIQIASGADVTIDITDATITASGANTVFQVLSGGTLTIKGKPSTLTISGSGGLISSAGTLNVTDATLTAGDITVIGSLANFSNSTIAGGLTVEQGATAKITSGTFDGTITTNSGIIDATGGAFLKNSTTGADDNAKVATVGGYITSANKSNYSAYTDGDTNTKYVYVEPTLTADNINFTFPETLVEDEATIFNNATYEGSETSFTYTIGQRDANGDIVALPTGVTATFNTDPQVDGASTEADDQSVTINTYGSYVITVATTFDPTIKKDIDFTVSSSLEDLSIVKVNVPGTSHGSGEDIATEAADNTWGGEKTDITLYTGDVVVFNFDSTSGAAYTSRTATVGEEDRGIISTEAINANNQFKLTASNAGTGTVVVQALAADGETVLNSFTLNVTVYDHLEAGDLQGVNTTISLGQTIETRSLIAAATDSEKDLNLDDYTYSATVSSGSNAYANGGVNNDEGTITATTIGATTTVLTITVTDGSGAEVNVPVTVYIVTAFEVQQNEEKVTAIDVKEQNEAGATINLVATTAAEALPASYNFEFGIMNDEDEFEANDAAVALLSVAADAEAADQYVVTAGEIDTIDVAYIRITSGELEQILKVTVVPELVGSALVDSEGNVVATADTAENSSVTVKDAVALIEGNVAEYAITATSANAPFKLSAKSSNPAAVIANVNEDNKSVSVIGTAATSEAATVTIEVIGSYGESMTYTLSVNVAENTNPEVPAPAKNGVFTIISALGTDGNRALDVNGASVDSGANIQLWRNNGTIAQKFIFQANENGYYTITNLKSGLLMTANDTNVEQRTAATADSAKDYQLWQLIPVSDDSYMIVSKATGLYVDVTRGSSDQGTNIQLYAANGEKSQLFTLSSVASFEDNQAVPTGTTTTIISALSSDRALDILGAGTGNGANLQLWRANGTDAQNFTFELLDNGYYKIYTGTGDGKKVLDVSGAGTAQGTNVDQWRDNGTIAQQWLVRKNSDGTFTITSRCNGLALDLSGAGTDQGTNVQLWRDNGTGAQKFYLPGITTSSSDKTTSEDTSEETPAEETTTDTTKE